MLLDTSGLLCLHHKAEPLHEKACKFYGAAHIRLTHNYVISEFIALSSARRLPRQAALTFITDLLMNPDVETIWVDKAMNNAAISLLRQREDKTYSLCDAVSFVLMRQRSIYEALTTDRHFQQEGFRRLLV